MAKTPEEEMEELQSTVSNHEEILACIIHALLDEESLSQDARDEIREAYNLIYGIGKK